MTNITHSMASPDPLFSLVSMAWHLVPGGMREMFIVVGAMAGISLLVLGWAVFIRKPGRRHHHRHHRHHQRPPSEEETQPRRKWRRKRRQDHRPRNPTLAETGGLPPVRTGPPIDPGL